MNTREWERRGVEIVEGTVEGFDFDARYRRVRYGVEGVAYAALGYQVEPDEDTEWSGCYNRTGLIAVQLVGDDYTYFAEPDDLQVIPDEAYCTECGQIGCCGDARDRSEATA
jgi:hypothetical protein